MIGVNLDAIDNLIKKNNNYLNSFNNDSKKLINFINDFNDCYKGNSVEYLFFMPIKEIKNIRTISKIIENYSNILLGAKNSYQKEDSNLKSQVNHINSNFK